MCARLFSSIALPPFLRGMVARAVQGCSGQPPDAVVRAEVTHHIGDVCGRLRCSPGTVLRRDRNPKAACESCDSPFFRSDAIRWLTWFFGMPSRWAISSVFTEDIPFDCQAGASRPLLFPLLPLNNAVKFRLIITLAKPQVRGLRFRCSLEEASCVEESRKKRARAATRGRTPW